MESGVLKEECQEQLQVGLRNELPGRSYNRRSSILKPAKQRNPLQELDFNPTTEEEPTVNDTRKLRRVSFASSTNVKEFHTETATMTLWGSTSSYIQKTIGDSDSSHQSDTSNIDPHNMNPLHISNFEELVSGKIIASANDLQDWNTSFETDNAEEIIIEQKIDTVASHTAQNGHKQECGSHYKSKMEISTTHTHTKLFSSSVSQSVEINQPAKNQSIFSRSFPLFDKPTPFTQNVQPETKIEGDEEVEADEFPEHLQADVSANEALDLTKKSTSFLDHDLTKQDKRTDLDCIVSHKSAVYKQLGKKTTDFQDPDLNTTNEKLTSPGTDLFQLNQLHLPNNLSCDGSTVEELLYGEKSPHAFNTTHFGENLDFSEQFQQALDGQQSHSNKTSYVNEMELTEPVSIGHQDNVVCMSNKTIYNDAMDLTEAMPSNYQANCTQFFNKTIDNDGMDLTNVIPSKILGNCTLMFNKTVQNDSMEFTEVIPSNIQGNGTHIFNKTVNNGEMDFTEVIPSYINDNRTHIFNKTANNGEMEFTEVIPSNIQNNRTHIFNKTENNDSMEITEVIPSNIQGNRTHIFNKTAINGEMEFTEVIPSNIQGTHIFNKTANNGEMELTEVIPSNIQNNPTHIFNKTANNDSMEITEVIPSNIQGNCTHIFNKTANNGEMEFTDVIPSNIQNNRTHIFSKTVNNDSMEFTEVIPSNIQGDDTHLYYECVNNDSMELTHAITSNISINHTKILDESTNKNAYGTHANIAQIPNKTTFQNETIQKSTRDTCSQTFNKSANKGDTDFPSIKLSNTIPITIQDNNIQTSIKKPTSEKAIELTGSFLKDKNSSPTVENTIDNIQVHFKSYETERSTGKEVLCEKSSDMEPHCENLTKARAQDIITPSIAEYMQLDQVKFSLRKLPNKIIVNDNELKEAPISEELNNYTNKMNRYLNPNSSTEVHNKSNVQVEQASFVSHAVLALPKMDSNKSAPEQTIVDLTSPLLKRSSSHFTTDEEMVKADDLPTPEKILRCEVDILATSDSYYQPETNDEDMHSGEYFDDDVASVESAYEDSFLNIQDTPSKSNLPYVTKSSAHGIIKTNTTTEQGVTQLNDLLTRRTETLERKGTSIFDENEIAAQKVFESLAIASKFIDERFQQRDGGVTGVLTDDVTGNQVLGNDAEKLNSIVQDESVIATELENEKSNDPAINGDQVVYIPKLESDREKIISRASSSKHWKIAEIDEDDWVFTFFHKKLELVLHLDSFDCNHQVITDAYFVSKLSGKAHPFCKYIHQKLINNYPGEMIKSLCPNTQDLPALLSSISTEVENFTTLLKDLLLLEKMYNLQMNVNSVRFELASLLTHCLFEITIDLSTSWDHLAPDYIHIQPIIGCVDVADIKQLLSGIRTGPHFLRDYIEDVYKYKRALESYVSN